MQVPAPIWLVGCGNMAGAMLRRWLDAGLAPATVTVIRPSGVPVAPGVRVVPEPPLDEVPALVMLGVKPQKLDEVVPAYQKVIGPHTTLVSILAGVEQAALRARFPAAGAIIRAMPNTPSALGKGATALYSADADEEARATAERLMSALGRFEWIEDEAQLHLVAALTASGPAFVFRFIDALADGAAALGLPPEQARRLATATVEGAAMLAAASPESPHQLAERVASPGGMTRQGLNVLDHDESLRDLLRRTLQAASERSRELGEAAARRD